MSNFGDQIACCQRQAAVWYKNCSKNGKTDKIFFFLKVQ
jgi:hypothetical protein